MKETPRGLKPTRGLQNKWLIGTTKQAAEKLILRPCVPPAKANSDAKINGLDAGLKASSTRTKPGHDFFSSL